MNFEPVWMILIIFWMNLNEFEWIMNEFWWILNEFNWIWMNLNEFKRILNEFWMIFQLFSFHFLHCKRFSLFFSFFKLFLLLRLSKMPKNFSPRPTLCSGLGKIWYILVGRARQKTVNFFSLKLSFQFNLFPFWTVFFNSNIAKAKYRQTQKYPQYPKPRKQSYC